MKDKGRVALARIVFANREHILSIEPWGKGMLGTTLRYDYEIRDEKKFFKGIPSLRLKKDMVEWPVTYSIARPVTSIQESSKTSTSWPYANS
jgi:non-homologous end joining protein Ku